MQLRLEMYNAWNHTQFNAFANNPTFDSTGKITTHHPDRREALLLKKETPGCYSGRVRRVKARRGKIKEERQYFGGAMFRRILLAAAAAVSLAIPQEVEEVLTNAEIAEMLKAGLAESTIERAIELAAERGTTRFETTSQALIDLKNQGATTSILDAMLAADALPKRVLPSTTVPGLPAKRGVYYRADSRWAPLPSVLVWPEINTRWRGTTAIEDRRYVLAGADAGLRVQEALPSFHVRGMDSQRTWRLIRLDTRNSYREWRTVPAELLRYSPLAEPRQVPPHQLDYRVVAHDVIELRPATALEPGQYALAVLMPGQRWLVETYEFSVGQSP